MSVIQYVMFLAIWVLLRITHWRLHHAPAKVVAAGQHALTALIARHGNGSPFVRGRLARGDFPARAEPRKSAWDQAMPL